MRDEQIPDSQERASLPSGADHAYKLADALPLGSLRYEGRVGLHSSSIEHVPTSAQWKSIALTFCDLGWVGYSSTLAADLLNSIFYYQ